MGHRAGHRRWPLPSTAVPSTPQSPPDERDASLNGKGEHPEDLAIGTSGGTPVGIAPWALMWRRRLAAKVEQSPNQPWIVLWTALFGLFAVQFTITILAVSIAGIADDFGTEESTVDWVLTGPLLGFAVTGPAAGKLADRYGHRRVYLFGLTAAMVFNGLSGLAWSAGSLITFRVMGALLGAATGPSSMAMINQLFAPAERARAMGMWSLVMAGGPVFGVVAGGPIVEQFGWRWIFFGQVPLILAGLLIAYAVLPESTAEPRNEPIDLTGILLLAAGTLAGMLALNQAPSAGWSSPLILLGFALTPVLIGAFVVWERRTDHPLLPLPYFSRRNFVFPVMGQFFTMFAYMGGFYLTPFMLDKVFGYNEARIGLLTISRPLAFAVTGPIAGYLAVKIGERTSAVFGTLTIAASMFALAAVSGGGSADAIVLVALALSGVGLGAVAPVMSSTVANAVDDRDLGIAGAAQQMMSQIGIVVGITVLLAVQRSNLEGSGVVEGDPGYTDALSASFTLAYSVGGAVCFLAVVCAAFLKNTKDDRTLVDAAA